MISPSSQPPRPLDIRNRCLVNALPAAASILILPKTDVSFLTRSRLIVNPPTTPSFPTCRHLPPFTHVSCVFPAIGSKPFYWCGTYTFRPRLMHSLRKELMVFQVDLKHAALVFTVSQGDVISNRRLNPKVGANTPKDVSKLERRVWEYRSTR